MAPTQARAASLVSLFLGSPPLLDNAISSVTRALPALDASKMLDPLTTATTCIGLINGIASLTLHITAFVNDVRGARKDMDFVSRELTSLSLCLSALRADCTSQHIEYSAATRKGIEQALLNIDVLVQQVKDLLQKLSSGKLGRRIQWTVQSRDTVDKLRSSLETQKSVIEIALQCGSIQMLVAVQTQTQQSKKHVEEIKDDTKAIRQDAQILRKDAIDIKELIRQETHTLLTEISMLERSSALTPQLQEFLVQSQSYSEKIRSTLPTPEPSYMAVEEDLANGLARSSLESAVDLKYRQHIERLESENRVISQRSRDLEEELRQLENELLQERLQRRKLYDEKKPDTKPLAAGFAEISDFGNAPATTLPKVKASWTITKDEKKIFDDLFKAWDGLRTGFLIEDVAVEIMSQSGLDRKDLEAIWTLSDQKNRGHLDIDEFAVAMFLVYRKLNGYPVPSRLPPELDLRAKKI